jgi:CheY-like chemotaxis protein
MRAWRAHTVTRILLVDDHAVVRRGVRDILTESLGKVTFGEASKPSEAIEKLQGEDWDVVVLDISLPGAAGSMLFVRSSGCGRTCPCLCSACTPRITTPCVPCEPALLAT